MRDILDVIAQYQSDAVLLTGERDKAILQAHAEGRSIQAIARAAGMSRQGMAKFLARNVGKDLTTELHDGILQS